MSFTKSKTGNFQPGFKRLTQFGASLVLIALLIIEPIFAVAPKSSFNKPDVKSSKVLSENQRVKQVLTRLTFGARPGDFEKIKAIGIKNYINQQLDPESIDDSALNQRLEKIYTLRLPTPTLAEQYNPPKPPPSPTPAANNDVMKPSAMPTPTPTASPSPTEKTIQPETAKSPAPKPSPTPQPKNLQMVVNDLQRAAILRAVYSERQLNEVIVNFWENHFNIFINKDADRWLMTEFDRDAIRPFALGRFRDLLGATARSPAMLYYLDNWQSSVIRKYPATKDKPAGQTGGINENYARELMELHTLGVNGGYTQKDVQEVARCFTGWTIRKPGEEGTFMFNPSWHDNGEKIVLGQKIPAGGGIADAEKVLDILAKHPSTARFIATKLARRFYGDNPPKLVVAQAAQVFTKTGGSIRETLRSIITSPQFLAPNTYQTKVKSPFEFVASALRILDAETDGNRPLLDWVTKMGQPIFGHITPEGYPDQSDEWLSSGSLLVRFNFANALATNKIKGTKIEIPKILNETAPENSPAVIARLTDLVLANEVTTRTKEQILKTAETEAEAAKKVQEQQAMDATNNKNIKPKTPPVKPLDTVAQLLTLVIGSPEFQRK